MLSHTAEIPILHAPESIHRRASKLILASIALVPLLSALSWAVLSVEASAPRNVTVATSEVFASLNRRPSHNGRYIAEAVAETPIAVGVRQRWTLHVSRPDLRPLEGATIEARSWMPESGTTSPVRATMRYRGGDKYEIRDLVFSTPGWWNVALIIKARDGIDSLAFNVRLGGRTTAQVPR
jgi:hypothetical protein